MRENKIGAILIKSYALLVVLSAAHQAMAQDAKTTYPRMAPIDQYLMPHREAEIALARSAAPESVSRDATILPSDHGAHLTVPVGWESSPPRIGVILTVICTMRNCPSAVQTGRSQAQPAHARIANRLIHNSC